MSKSKKDILQKCIENPNGQFGCALTIDRVYKAMDQYALETAIAFASFVLHEAFHSGGVWCCYGSRAGWLHWNCCFLLIHLWIVLLVEFVGN